jgi:uncharacterized protein with HEPN domain
MNSDDRVRLQHIADALRAAIRFTEGRSREDLDGDQMLSFALLHAIQIVGEAASKISAEFREQHSQIPWMLITGMRHRLVHAYFDIDHNILWATATDSVPELLVQVDGLLASD